MNFDYIIAGAGCAGRSLALRMLPYLQDSGKRLLLVDKFEKNGQDKTWCFWEQDPGLFEPVVYRKWKHLLFNSASIQRKMDISPYQYKMIRSADFYDFTTRELAASDHVTNIQGTVAHLYADQQKAYAVIGGKTYISDYAFSSIPNLRATIPARYQYLLQHFMGWIIESEELEFDTDCATLMDFNTLQQAGTSFVYVLPLSKHSALVEYTVFSACELEMEDYARALKTYIAEQLHCRQYTVKEQEYGIIPMSDHPAERTPDRIITMGTAGGFTKGSTGYTFSFIQKHTSAIAAQLEKSGSPRISSIFPGRFSMYDATLLHLLGSGGLSGEDIFTTMFRKNNPAGILKFLDNETSILEELQIFSTLQKKEFASALIQRVMKLIKTRHLN